MNSQVNSFRLQRLNKTNSIKDQSQILYNPKETFKLAALNSINRTIKYNDLSYTAGKTDLNKLRKEPEVSGDLEFQSAHHNLDGVRKNYDSAHKIKTKKEQSINKLKDEKVKLSIAEGELLDNKEKGNKKVAQLQGQKQKIKLCLWEAETQKKVLLHMKSRLKHDKIIFDQRRFNMEKDLKFLKTQLNLFKKDGTEIHESDDRTDKVYRKYLRQLNAERQERQNHLNSVEAMIEEKRKVNEINEARERQIMDIAERAMQDKDDNEKNWEKLYLTNKFLSRMLRDKMDKEMSKFFVVESAFKSIKIATGVNDAETLVNKFLNKEKSYGELLGRIAENQKKIQSLKFETDGLLREHKELEAEREDLEATKKVIPTIAKQSKQMDETNEKVKKTNLMKEKLRNWVIRNLKKFNLVFGSKHQTNIGRDQKEAGQAFISYLSLLSEEIVKAEEEESKMDKFDEGDKLKNEKKANRIGNKNAFDDESEEEPTIGYEESDLLSGQRNQIHRQNEKFMRDLKKKTEELRKQKAESLMPKKQAEKAPEKPKEEVE